MNTNYSYGWGPSVSSRALQLLIGCLAMISIVSSFLDGIFVYYFSMNGPQSLLSLSWGGLQQWYIWQPLSYLFVLSSGNAGLTFGVFLELFFDLYIIWIMGSTLLARTGAAAFFRFYFICGMVSGLLTLLCMPLIQQYTALAGPTSAIIAIMAAWTMLHPEIELLLFFVMPIKVKWLFTGMLGALLLINLSHLNFIMALFELLSALVAYLYATIIWELTSPFAFSATMDRWLVNLGIHIRHLRLWRKLFATSHLPHSDKESKIYDFHTGTPQLSDDAFMDAMLDKILHQGEKSLTWSERMRMKKIAERKSRSK
jgi:membrane associated rhomboid family serine protease